MRRKHAQLDETRNFVFGLQSPSLSSRPYRHQHSQSSFRDALTVPKQSISVSTISVSTLITKLASTKLTLYRLT